jgi:hypothetical protein
MEMRANGAHEYVSPQLELELKFCGSLDSTETCCVASLAIQCVEGNETLASVAYTFAFTMTLQTAVRLVNGVDLGNLIFSELCC